MHILKVQGEYRLESESKNKSGLHSSNSHKTGDPVARNVLGLDWDMLIYCFSQTNKIQLPSQHLFTRDEEKLIFY